MRVIVVTTCTNRKKFPTPPELDASRLDVGSQTAVAAAWRNRVKSATPLGTAAEVYCGRSFREAALAARAAHADFRIISGGLGLIRYDEAMPSYRLSLLQQSPEFIGARIGGAPFDAALWWCAIQQTVGAFNGLAE